MIRPLDPRRSPGFSLVEVTLALGVAAFCLTALLGLLPVGLNNNQISISQTDAASIARAVTADLRNTAATKPPTDQMSPSFKITVPGTSASATGLTHTLFFTEDGQPGGTQAAGNSQQDQNAVSSLNPRYRATMTFTPPASSASTPHTATTVRILVTWPASADPKAAAAPSNYSGSYEVVTALNRN